MDSKELTNYVDQYEVFGNKVMVAIYRRPEKTKGGIFLTDSEREEDVYQGKVGKVLKLGPGCFKDSPDWNFYGQSASIGEWVVFRTSDGIHQRLGDVDIRIFKDIHILGKVQNPELVW